MAEEALQAPRCAVHPELPAVRPCPRCGAFACQGCLATAADGAVVCAACQQRTGRELPWDRKDRVGTARAFAQTCWQILVHPRDALGRAKAEGSLGSSLGFAVLASFCWLSSSVLLWGLLMVGAAVSATALQKEAGVGTPWVAALLGAMGLGAVMTSLGVVTVLATVLGGAALDHLVLRIIGAKPKPFEVTLRAHALSYAPSLMGLVPLCGGYVVPLWAAALRVIAYQSLHQISGRKAAVGALAVPAVLIALVMVGYVALLVVVSALGNQ